MNKKPIPLPKLLAKAQVVFNKYIRERDKDNGCISCPGPVENAGHYLSQGHNSLTRFSEMNTNGQCIRCNKYLHGNLISYRQSLIIKYGENNVLLLERSRGILKKWSRPELLAIIQVYSNLTK